MKSLLFPGIALLLTLSFLSFQKVRDIPAIGKQIIGRQIIYSYHNESIGYSDIARLYTPDTGKIKKPFAQSPSLQMAEVIISCQITRTMLQKTGDSILVLFQVGEPEIDIKSGQDRVNADMLKKEITHPVLATISSHGKIGTIRTDSSMEHSSVTLIKEMLSRLQFVTSGDHANQWQTTEYNSIGEYLAAYRFIKKTNGLYEYEKFNRGYTNKESLTGNQHVRPEGKSVILSDSLGNIREETVSEKSISLVAGDTISISRSKIRIGVAGESEVSADRLSELAQLSDQALYSKKSTLSSKLKDEELRDIAFRSTLGQDNLGSLSQQLSGLRDTAWSGPHDPDGKTKEQLIMKFRSLASLSSEDCKKMGKMLEKEPYGSLNYEILGHALTRTKTSTATDVLAALILSRKTEEEVMLNLLPALAMTTSPTDKALQVTRELGFEDSSSMAVKSTAQLALGGLAFNFRKTDTAKAEYISAYLMDKLKTERDTIQKILILANTGSPSILPLIRSYLNNVNTSEYVRVSALKATRLIYTNETSQLLSAMLQNKDKRMQTAAKELIAFRKEYFGGNE